MGFLGFFKGGAEKAPENAHLDRVHLIVHPGDGLREGKMEAEERLLQTIASRAISLEKRNEIAVVLLQMSEEEWERARDPDFTGKEHVLASEIGRIQTALPQNVIVIPGAPSVAYPCLDGAFENVRKKIGESGFTIDQNTELLAYGEMVTKCVPAGASYFANHFELKQPPVIDVNYTDALISDAPLQWSRNGIRLSVAQTLSGGGLQYIPMKE